MIIYGNIHSIESMGLVDGPGIRTVVFFQGCSLRCKFCHNPDTWNFNEGIKISTQELITKIKRYKPYFERSSGGVTFSGGEPLMQPEFLLEMLKLCKASGINTCLDTAGVGFGNYKEILKYTDLILYDIKHIDPKAYKSLTGKSQDETNDFLKVVSSMNIPVIARHVVVPGLTDTEKFMKELKIFAHKHIKNLIKVELLPYHLLGVNKYKELSIPYPLKGVKAMDKTKTEYLQNHYFS